MSTISLLPSAFAEKVYMVEGSPFSLKGREYLKAIYDAEIKEGLVKSGRQVEKSTTLSIKMANDIPLRPFNKSLYVAPALEQVKAFSKTRLQRILNYSQNDFFKKTYVDRDSSDNVMMKTFSNGSIIYLRHCFEEGDNIRSLSVNNLYIDETQDIVIDAIPVVKETQSHAVDPKTNKSIAITWYMGTPKTFSNTIEELWQKSTQNEWVVKCFRCNKYQILGMPNLTPQFRICAHCKQQITPEMISAGFWKEMNPGALRKGFHISQVMVSWISMDGPEGLWTKYENYSPSKFHNEVLGESYESADKPFSDRLLFDIADNDLDFISGAENEFANTENFMGIDWGSNEDNKAHTVITIFAYNKYGKFQLLYTKMYDKSNQSDTDTQLRDIGRMINAYRIRVCAVDYGFGHVQIERLRSVFGSRIIPIYYSNPKEKIKWDDKKQWYIVNRSDVITDYIQFLNQHSAMWPGKCKNDYKFLFNHHSAVFSEYRTGRAGRSEELVYNHPSSAPDDGMHSCVYAYLASKLYKGGTPSPIVGTDYQFYGVYSRN